MLRITILCNAGILLDYGGQTLLIDGICQSAFGFYGLQDRDFGDMMQGAGAYSALRGVIFTHCHPDHFDETRVELLRSRLPDCTFWVPDEDKLSSGCIQCGPFSVYYYETPHMPQDYSQVRHFVLRIEVGGLLLYVAADAALDVAMHDKLMGPKRYDCVIVNPVYLSTAETRTLLQKRAPRRIVVYHLPGDKADQTGIRRKTERTISRFAAQLPPLTAADQYPTTILLGEQHHNRTERTAVTGQG